MRAIFVVNERSGRRRDFDVAELIRLHCAWDAEIVSCHSKEQLDGIVDGAEAGNVDVVYAVGGDGTVHETAKRLIGRRPALGILPIGSGNGFARHIGLPLDVAECLRRCGEGEIIPIDTAEVNGIPFLGVMGIGFDAVVAERFASSSVRGLETYVREGLRAYATFTADDYEIESEGERLRRRAFVIAIANSGQYGNNARVAPLASLRDGLLDVVIVGEPSLVDAPMMLARLFSGSFHRSSAVTTMRTRDIIVRRRAPGPAHLDGEPVTLPAELHVRVRPLSLRLLVPDARRAL